LIKRENYDEVKGNKHIKIYMEDKMVGAHKREKLVNFARSFASLDS